MELIPAYTGESLKSKVLLGKVLGSKGARCFRNSAYGVVCKAAAVLIRRHDAMEAACNHVRGGDGLSTETVFTFGLYLPVKKHKINSLMVNYILIRELFQSKSVIKPY